jgi:hypothetical protein
MLLASAQAANSLATDTIKNRIMIHLTLIAPLEIPARLISSAGPETVVRRDWRLTACARASSPVRAWLIYLIRQ